MSDASSLASIDANVILRYLLEDNEEQSALALEIFHHVESGQIRALCNPVNLAEATWVLKSL